MTRHVGLLSCRDVIGHHCSVEKKLDFKRGKEVLEEVEKFYYLDDLISCYGGASETVSAKTGIAWKKFRKLEFIFEATGKDLSGLY